MGAALRVPVTDRTPVTIRHEGGSQVTRNRRLLIGVVGVVLFVAAVGELCSLLILQRRYHAAVTSRRQMEQQLEALMGTHERLKTELASERTRSQELLQELGGMRGRLEEIVGRFTEETQRVRKLQAQLTSVQQQMEQLQGELVLALEQQRHASTEASGPVQLERIVVSRAPQGPDGRVVSVHRDWNFVVINLGWDAVRIGDTVSIVRDGQVQAKARVERVQEGVCAASMLPEWEAAEVQVNDLVQVL